MPRIFFAPKTEYSLSGIVFAESPIMINKSSIFFLALFLCQSFAQAEPHPDQHSLCEMKSEDFVAKSFQGENLTSVRNNPGAIYTGLCWWHSRMQRNAIYLTVFDKPEASKPTREQARKIFETLTAGDSVVSIPGYKNWLEFTVANRDLMNSVLYQWEIRDTLFFNFAKGIRLNSGTTLQTYKEISREVNQFKRVTYVMLKEPKGDAHAWLINSIENTSYSGFIMTFIDSNFPSGVSQYSPNGNKYFIWRPHTNTYWDENRQPYDVVADFEEQSYPEQKNSVDIQGRPMTLYIQNDILDFMKYKSAIQKYCGHSTPFTQFEDSIEPQKLNLKKLSGF